MNLAWYYSLLYPFRGVLKRYPKIILQLRYYKKFHRFMDLKHPKNIDEKIYWLSLNTDTTLWSTLADKYAVRDYVKDRCGEGVLNKLLGVWDNPDEIDFEKLPQSFVIKTNNGCATNIIVKDKSKLNIAETRQKLRAWLNYPYGIMVGEPHYLRIVPKIIAEELLVQDGDRSKSLVDYKFFCIDGRPTFFFFFCDRKPNSHEYKENLYDAEWNACPQYFVNDDILKDFAKPACYDELLKHVRELAKGFKVVRVDFYVIDNKPIFGELTFTPGPDEYFNEEYENMMGKLIALPSDLMNDK